MYNNRNVSKNDTFNNCCENGTYELRKTCEKIFDGILEWPETNAGDLVFLPCPEVNANNFGHEFHVKVNLDTFQINLFCK